MEEEKKRPVIKLKPKPVFKSTIKIKSTIPPKPIAPHKLTIPTEPTELSDREEADRILGSFDEYDY